MHDLHQILGMTSRVEEASGAADILVRNVGVQHMASVEEFPQD